jgi:hypothetical protein
VSDDVELPARNTGGNIVPAIGGAVPKGTESEDEGNAGYEDEGWIAEVNIELLEVEGALSDAGCVELTATVEFLPETIHVPCQPTLYDISRTTMAIMLGKFLTLSLAMASPPY